MMNWDKSQMAASAFAKGHGGMSLGQQWAFSALLREDGGRKSVRQSKETAEAVRRAAENAATLRAVMDKAEHHYDTLLEQMNFQQFEDSGEEDTDEETN